MQTIYLAVAAYLLGSIPFGKIAGNLKNIDIQKKGSGNIGFANALRVMGWRIGLLVLAGDIAKGYLPVLIATNYLSVHGIMLVALAAIAGHVFPPWLKFKGGKGIATGLGVTLAISPLLGLLGLAVYLSVVGLARKAALSSLTAAASLPIFCLLFLRDYFWFYLLLAAAAIWTHRSNIKKMRRK